MLTGVNLMLGAESLLFGSWYLVGWLLFFWELYRIVPEIVLGRSEMGLIGY